MNKHIIFLVFFGAVFLLVTRVTSANNIPSRIPDFDKLISGTITSVNNDEITITTKDVEIVEQVNEYLAEQGLDTKETDDQNARTVSGRDRIIYMMNERRERENSLKESSDNEQEVSVTIKTLVSQSPLNKNLYQLGNQVLIDGKYESLRNVIIARELFNAEDLTRKKR